MDALEQPLRIHAILDQLLDAALGGQQAQIRYQNGNDGAQEKDNAQNHRDEAQKDSYAGGELLFVHKFKLLSFESEKNEIYDIIAKIG